MIWQKTLAHWLSGMMQLFGLKFFFLAFLDNAYVTVFLFLVESTFWVLPVWMLSGNNVVCLKTVLFLHFILKNSFYSSVCRMSACHSTGPGFKPWGQWVMVFWAEIFSATVFKVKKEAVTCKEKQLCTGSFMVRITGCHHLKEILNQYSTRKQIYI